MALYISPATAAPRTTSIFGLMDHPSDLFDDFFPFKRSRSCHRGPLARDPFTAMLLPHRVQCRRPRKQPAGSATPREAPGAGFSVAVPTHGFRPEEVETSVDRAARTVTVTGSSERRSEDGSSVSKRHFERTYTLPKSCDMDALELAVAKDGPGMLRITAPAVQEELPKEVCHDKKEEEEEKADSPKLKERIEKDEKMTSQEEHINKVGADKFSLSVDLGSKTDPGTIALEVDQKTRELTVRISEGEATSRHRIPEDFDLDGMRSAFDREEGRLHITAPRVSGTRSVPIVIH